MDIQNTVNRVIYDSNKKAFQLQSTGLLVNFADNPSREVLATYIYGLTVHSVEDYNLEFIEGIFLEGDKIIFHMLPETNEIGIIKEKLGATNDKFFTLSMVDAFEVTAHYFVKEFLQNLKEMLG